MAWPAVVAAGVLWSELVEVLVLPALMRIGADLGVPPGTVRGWLRRLRSRAEEMRGFAMRQLGAIGGEGPALPEPASSPLHDALNAVAAAAHAAITGHGFGPADLWPLLGRFGLARHLMPARVG